jgi:uncharacterized protein (DUF169 family)
MEEKEINSMASAISNALAKLNADAAVTKEKEEDKPEEIFRCPECDASVKGGIAFCQVCGCPLEWED